MTTIYIYGPNAKAIAKLRAFGTYKADGISFTITQRTKDSLTLEIEAYDPWA